MRYGVTARSLAPAGQKAARVRVINWEHPADNGLPLVVIELKKPGVPFCRPSLLACAFAGKLVAQDPNDEPAEELSEGIQRENGRQRQKGGK